MARTRDSGLWFWVAAAVSLVASLTAWGPLVLYPFKLFTTWVHECGHAARDRAGRRARPGDHDRAGHERRSLSASSRGSSPAVSWLRRAISAPRSSAAC